MLPIGTMGTHESPLPLASYWKASKDTEKCIAEFCCDLLAIFPEHSIKQIAGKLRNITPAQFELITFRFAHGRTQQTHFYDFGTLRRVPEPQNQYDLSLETPRHFKKT